MDLFEHETKVELRREEAADRLRELADQLSRHNEVAFLRDGVRYTVKVPATVTLKFEVEIEDDGSEVELKIEW